MEEQIKVGSEVPELKLLTQKTAYGFSVILLTICLLFGLYKKIFEKNQKKNAPDLINIISKKAVNNKSALLVVEVLGSKYLLSQSAERLEMISEIFQKEDKDSYDVFEKDLKKINA